MRALVLLLTTIVFSVCSAVLQATTIHVPADQPTIQAGIDAAVDGDTVLVADGTYTGDGNRDIDFFGKAIVVISENGPGSCIIDCEGDSLNLHRGFYFHKGEDSSSIVEGFTITNGYSGNIYGGGGIRCDSSSSPTIKGNFISGTDQGGGIYCIRSSSPAIVENVISENTTLFSGAGITCAMSSSPRIEGNDIIQNVAESNGGGIACFYDSNPIILNNRIAWNEARQTSGGSGGIHTYDASPTIIGNLIVGNTAKPSNYTGGGGIILAYSSSRVERNVITGNTASWGGGIYIWHAFPTLHANTIAGNTARYVFGANGGGVCAYDSCEVTLTNNIIWDNDADLGDEIYVGQYSGPAIVTIGYSDVRGGRDSAYVEPGATLNWGEGMIDADPMFVLPEKRDSRLLWESPCIDTGHPDSVDADGTRSDVGAHFFDQDDYLTLYVTPDTTEFQRGGPAGVTYTVINRWLQPEPFWHIAGVILPDGSPLIIQGPDHYTLPASYTAQLHSGITVPQWFPLGQSEFRAWIGLPPSTLYDKDRFFFIVVQ